MPNSLSANHTASSDSNTTYVTLCYRRPVSAAPLSTDVSDEPPPPFNPLKPSRLLLRLVLRCQKITIQSNSSHLVQINCSKSSVNHERNALCAATSGSNSKEGKSSRALLMPGRDLNESYSGMTRDPSSGYSRSKARTRDPPFTRLVFTRESNESSTRDSGEYSLAIRIANESKILARHIACIHLTQSPFMPDEHPRAIARGHSAVHEAGTEGGGGDGGDGGSDSEMVVMVVVRQQQQARHGAKPKIQHLACSQGQNTHPKGRLTIVRAAEATIVALWVVVVMTEYSRQVLVPPRPYSRSVCDPTRYRSADQTSRITETPDRIKYSSFLVIRKLVEVSNAGFGIGITTGASKPCGENLCEDKTHVKESYRVIGEKVACPETTRGYALGCGDPSRVIAPDASGKSNKDNMPR
ncbi:hypothetical protein BDZ89DRAFT_1120237 [Hymenopellis radicata]|nr:hypothetical protein BDZ89DRAFT_1120237 [Hymenopellis radicata]